MAAGWQEIGSTPEGEVLHLSFALAQQNLAELERVFWEVSDPRSPSYGNHMSLIRRLIRSFIGSFTRSNAIL